MDQLQSTAYVVSLGLGLLLLIRLYETIRPRSRHLPPGPLGLPIIGNLLDIPKLAEWSKYKELSKKYGKLTSLQMFGQTVIIIDDVDIAFDLLEKRSSIYSSRVVRNIERLTGWDWPFSGYSYGQWWRRHRRVFWQEFHPGAVAKYLPYHEEGARLLLSKLLVNPKNASKDIRYSLGVGLMRATYGLEVAESNDKYISTFEAGLSTVDVLTSVPPLLEAFPVFAKLPTWLPGTGFLRKIARAREANGIALELPWSDAKERIRTGSDSNSMVATMVQRISRITGQSASTEEEIAKKVAAMVYEAGIETTQATLCAFLIAMSLYPEVQKKAQAELDDVVGGARLPQLADRDALPYVNAIVKETLRWHTTVPIGLPHANIEDDEYDGYLIPRNSIIVVNAWFIMHDPKVYPEPDEFIPERFLKDNGVDQPDNFRDLTNVAFGFGRRICPGRYLADAALFIYIASLLHTFDVTPPLDNDGRPIRTWTKEIVGFVSLPQCNCMMTPRSVKAEALIRDSRL